MGRMSADGVVVPECDTRQYAARTLPNGLQVLLVSDPLTDKAAAAMNVDVGYFSDPDDVPGLAHFLEHMLFYASEKYPKEGSYAKFLAEHGGCSNAYTSMENTNYQLDVSWDHLDEALDRFAQFFICPLLSADGTSREMNAVHSEHVKNLTSDLWRFSQLQKTFSAPTHPYHKFGSGNMLTLGETPATHGKDTREELLAFYDRHYSANAMHLVVYGRDSIERLEEMVTREGRFASIKNKSLAPLRFLGDPCSDQHTKVLVRAVPVKQGHALDLVWAVPPSLPKYRTSPSNYVSHLLGHEGHGSLFALLKKKGWATSLCAGEAESSWHFAFFSITIELTDEGNEHVEEVLKHVFEYVGLLRSEGGITEWIFKEMRDIAITKFNFKDKQQPFRYVTSLAAQMQLYPKEDWVAGASIPHDFDRDAIADVVNALSPANLRVFWSSKNFKEQAEATTEQSNGGTVEATWQSEQWYGTKYAAAPIDTGLLQELEAAYRGEKLASSDDLHLPHPNEFIPTDFTVLTPVQHQPEDVLTATPPSLVLDVPMARLWHKPDTQFGLPKAVLYLHMCSPVAYQSPEAGLLTRLTSSLVVDYLNEIAYDAEIAGLAYHVYPTVLGIQITVSGYSHKLLVLARKIVERLVAFEVREDRFHVVKAKALKDFENFRFDQAYQQAMYAASVMMEQRKWHLLDYLKLLPALTPDDLASFSRQLLRRIFLELYVAGNISREDAVAFAESVQQQMREGPLVKSQPCLAAEMPERRFLRLQDGSSTWFVTPNLNPDDENSAVVSGYQVAFEGCAADTPSATRHVVGQLLSQVLHDDAFHELRTVQQLGYIVFLTSRAEGGLHSVVFIIQSNIKDPRGVEERVAAFLQSSQTKLEAMSDDDFRTHVEALVALKKERKKNLGEDAAAVWREIDDGTLAFDRVEKEVNALRALTKDDLLEFMRNNVLPCTSNGNGNSTSSSNRRHFSIHVGAAKWTSGGSEVANSAAGEGEVSPPFNSADEAEGSAAADGAAAANGAAAADGAAAASGDGAAAADGVAAANGASEALSLEGTIVHDVFAFKRTQALHPSLRGSSNVARFKTSNNTK